MAAASSDSDSLLLDLSELEKPEVEVAAWCQSELDAEVARVRGMGQRVVPIAVLKTYLVRREVKGKKAGSKIVNTAELNTSFNFESAGIQLLLSDPKPCPKKEGYSYVHVVLVISPRAPPLIFGYMFKPDAENDMSTWRLINSEGKSTTLVVEGFSTAAPAASGSSSGSSSSTTSATAASSS